MPQPWTPWTSSIHFPRCTGILSRRCLLCCGPRLPSMVSTATQRSSFDNPKWPEQSETKFYKQFCSEESGIIVLFHNLFLVIQFNVICLRSLALRRIGQARVEVLLRQQAFKPKCNTSGDKLSGESGKSNLERMQNQMSHILELQGCGCCILTSF